MDGCGTRKAMGKGRISSYFYGFFHKCYSVHQPQARPLMASPDGAFGTVKSPICESSTSGVNELSSQQGALSLPHPAGPWPTIQLVLEAVLVAVAPEGTGCLTSPQGLQQPGIVPGHGAERMSQGSALLAQIPPPPQLSLAPRTAWRR